MKISPSITPSQLAATAVPPVLRFRIGIWLCASVPKTDLISAEPQSDSTGRGQADEEAARKNNDKGDI